MLVILVAGAACARREKACQSGAERKSKKERLRMSPLVLMMWTKILLAGKVGTLEKPRKTDAVKDASATSYASFARRALHRLCPTYGLTRIVVWEPRITHISRMRNRNKSKGIMS